LFPFYEPFLIAERAAVVRQEMKDHIDNHLQTRLAVNINQVRMPDFLRFCPLCLKDDQEKYGETYWHRFHQLAGVLVCPLHNCFLQNSSVRWARESSSLFHPAENISNIEIPRFLDKENFAHRIFIDLANDALWLLTQQKLAFEQGELRERYYNALLTRGFAFYNGKIRSKELFEAFFDFFKSEVLEQLGCSLEFSPSSWLSRLVNKTYSNVFHHPFRHLLLMKFLKIRAEEFFTEFVKFKPFKEPPYPCLNKIAPHFKEPRIKSCKIRDNITKKLKQRRPVAIFSCDCGFTYQRAGPDKTFNDRFRYDIVRNYGKLWETKLKKHWENLSLSLSEIARRFGTTTLLIARHAIRLELPMNIEGSRRLGGYERYRNPDAYLFSQIQECRNKWLNVIENNPADNRRDLIKKANTLYLWLQKNDSEWFNSHLPEQVKSNGKGVRLDWKKIDNELVQKIEIVCEEILKSTEKLVRVSITEIIRRVGHKTWIEKRRLKLPRTAELIDLKLESLEDFMIRKVKFTMNEYIKQGSVSTRLQFMVKAVIRNTTTENSSRVQHSIDKALTKISKLK
jgi:Tn7-like transposition protein D/TniQ